MDTGITHYCLALLWKNTRSDSMMTTIMLLGSTWMRVPIDEKGDLSVPYPHLQSDRIVWGSWIVYDMRPIHLRLGYSGIELLIKQQDDLWIVWVPCSTWVSLRDLFHMIIAICDDLKSINSLLCTPQMRKANWSFILYSQTTWSPTVIYGWWVQTDMSLRSTLIYFNISNHECW